MKYRFYILLLVFVFFISCQNQKKDTTDYTQYVDPLIGSGYHGHVFVGANVPFGAVQVGPNNETQGWDWCSGYHYSDSVIVGFAHTRLSGTGIGDLGDILFMPVTENFVFDEKVPYSWKSTYSHQKEKVSPGYYALHIDKYNVDAKLSATERAAFHNYQFNGKENAALVIDLMYGTGWDKIVKGEIEEVNGNVIRGYRYSSGWAKDQKVYFYTEFSKTISLFEILRPDSVLGNVTALISFEGNGTLLAKTGISFTSMEAARLNMNSEINHWDFEKTRQQAVNKWNDELSRIKITSNNISDKKIFYTALYHTMIAPSLFNDSNGDYKGADQQKHQYPGYQTYTTFSLWDTYRAAHPLFTLVQPERVNDFISTMLAIYDQQGKLPVWHLHANETNCMVGYHAIPVIADAYLKGIRGFDAEKAFEAMKASAMSDFRGVDFVKSKGYIPADTQNESVARAMEYAIDDWCIAAMATALGKTEDATYFAKRAKYYENYFDPQTRFMRGKLTDGSWRSPFNPIASQHNADDYCEGNAWQYLWLVPQNPEGLIEMLGGEKPFIAKLDSLFTISPEQIEGASSDISGLIGQYAHGNEPSHHTTYMYAFSGQQWKTASLVREI